MVDSRCFFFLPELDCLIVDGVVVVDELHNYSQQSEIALPFRSDYHSYRHCHGACRVSPAVRVVWSYGQCSCCVCLLLVLVLLRQLVVCFQMGFGSGCSWRFARNSGEPSNYASFMTYSNKISHSCNWGRSSSCSVRLSKKKAANSSSRIST